MAMSMTKAEGMLCTQEGNTGNQKHMSTVAEIYFRQQVTISAITQKT